MMAHEQAPLLHAPRTTKPISSFLLLSLVAALSSAIFITIYFINHDSSFSPAQLHKICGSNEQCLAITSEIAQKKANRRQELLQNLLEDSVTRIDKAARTVKRVTSMINDERERTALRACLELMDLSKDRTWDSLKTLQNAEHCATAVADAHTWLSTVLTNHMTCLDELAGQAQIVVDSELEDLIARAKTALAVFVKTYPRNQASAQPPFPINGGFPTWMTRRDRKLMQVSGKDITADVVVAQDGSGTYTNISDAVAAAPTNRKTRYIIYVKNGTYAEHILFGKSLKNIMLVGDGMNSTIITGRLNVADNTTTFNSATVAAVGDGFMAQDIWFKNTAGPQKHQAVALRIGADRSVINRCQIDAYQDTLYAHSNRQFYRDCNITGTVDFIFGNAAVVFQNCSLVPRMPMASQSNMVTAQGRTDPNQNTGTSIHNCSIVASPDLLPVMSSYATYLGRPWQKYSRTVVMQSYISDVINPAGWAIWNGTFALDTLYYGEYNNTGPGASTASRVSWLGYHVLNATEAAEFTVENLIQGGAWLNSSEVTFTLGL